MWESRFIALILIATPAAAKHLAAKAADMPRTAIGADEMEGRNVDTHWGETGRNS